MKYEAKQVGATTSVVSTASGAPWIGVSQTTAATSIATNVAGCTGCHLVTDAEWMTVAHNVLTLALTGRPARLAVDNYLLVIPTTHPTTA